LPPTSVSRSLTLRINALKCFQISGTASPTIQRHIPEQLILQQSRCENLKSRTQLYVAGKTYWYRLHQNYRARFIFFAEIGNNPSPCKLPLTTSRSLLLESFQSTSYGIHRQSGFSVSIGPNHYRGRPRKR
jgi:hypothetical protein